MGIPEAAELLSTPEFAIAAAVLGLVFGSFFNVCILRYESGESIALPPPPCMECGARLRPWELVPVLSWLALRGKCSHCGARISPQYPLVELLTSACFGLTALRFGPSAQCAAVLLFTSLFIIAAGIDARMYILPDIITLGSAPIALACSILALDVPWLQAVAGGAACAGVFWLVLSAFERLRGMEGLGFGNVKIMLPIGFLCGIAMLPMAVLISGLLALCFMIPAAVLHGGDIRAMRIPFGPFLCSGAWITLLAGDSILQWWLSVIL